MVSEYHMAFEKAMLPEGLKNLNHLKKRLVFKEVFGSQRFVT
jgi:hypothetical protein